MRVGIVVDASCDLPPEFFADPRVRIMPVAIRLDDRTLTDQRDPQQTLEFYRHRMAEAAQADTAPFSVEQIRELFLGQLVTDFDYVFCITVTASRSPIYDHAVKASHAILEGARSVREAAGLGSAFALRVVDSRSLFCGTGVIAAEALKLVRSGVPPNQIRQRLEDLTGSVVGYLVPRDLGHIRRRARRKGDRSVSLISHLVGSALDIRPVIRAYHARTRPVARIMGQAKARQRLFEHASGQLRLGLRSSYLCLSYGGPLEELEDMPGYAELVAAARERGVELLSSMMSTTACVNIGAGALALAWCGELRDFG